MLVDVANFQLNANSDKNLITAAANDFIGPCTQSYRFLIRVTANISLDVGTTYVNKCKSKKKQMFRVFAPLGSRSRNAPLVQD